MKQTYNQMLKKSLLGVASLLAVTACTDDHFDVLITEGTEAQNMYQDIKDNAKTAGFAKILSRTYVMKDEHDFSSKKDSICYSQLLQSAQFYTVWAPLDESYNVENLLKKLDRRDQLLAQNPEKNSKEFKEAWDINYRIANQFLLNHIARFNYASNMNKQKVRLLNSKLSYYNASEGKFNNVKVLPESYATSNGTLHLLDGVSPFAYNIYDYLRVAPEFTKLAEFMWSKDINKRIFSENSSLPGAMNDDGQMVYVDSIFFDQNRVISKSGAQLINEDSCYITVLPTNEAWDDAYEEMSNLFRYASSYDYDWDKSKCEFVAKAERALRFDKDSLQKEETKLMMLSDCYMSTTNFKVDNTIDSIQVNKYAQHSDSLISTNYNIFYNNTEGKVNPIFCGNDLNKPVKPVRASNGYIYAVDKYNFNPALTFGSRRMELEMAYGSNVASTKGEVTAIGDHASYDGQLIVLNPEDRNLDVKGEFRNNTYRYFEVDGNNKMYVYIPLKNVCSMKYRISAVILPNAVNKAKIVYEVNKKTGEEEEVVQHTRFKCEVRDDKNKLLKRSKSIEVRTDTIMTYELIPEVEIKQSYKNLPKGYVSFPTLQFVMSQTDQRKGHSKALSIARILIEPIRE